MTCKLFPVVGRHGVQLISIFNEPGRLDSLNGDESQECLEIYRTIADVFSVRLVAFVREDDSLTYALAVEFFAKVRRSKEVLYLESWDGLDKAPIKQDRQNGSPNESAPSTVPETFASNPNYSKSFGSN
ncbi:MAG: hypothetical protein ABF379_02430 [Akkermansiaceae bacterium]